MVNKINTQSQLNIKGLMTYIIKIEDNFYVFLHYFWETLLRSKIYVFIFLRGLKEAHLEKMIPSKTHK